MVEVAGDVEQQLLLPVPSLSPSVGDFFLDSWTHYSDASVATGDSVNGAVATPVVMLEAVDVDAAVNMQDVLDTPPVLCVCDAAVLRAENTALKAENAELRKQLRVAQLSHRPTRHCGEQTKEMDGGAQEGDEDEDDDDVSPVGCDGVETSPDLRSTTHSSWEAWCPVFDFDRAGQRTSLSVKMQRALARTLHHLQTRASYLDGLGTSNNNEDRALIELAAGQTHVRPSLAFTVLPRDEFVEERIGLDLSRGLTAMAYKFSGLLVRRDRAGVRDDLLHQSSLIHLLYRVLVCPNHKVGVRHAGIVECFCDKDTREPSALTGGQLNQIFCAALNLVCDRDSEDRVRVETCPRVWQEVFSGSTERVVVVGTCWKTADGRAVFPPRLRTGVCVRLRHNEGWATFLRRGGPAVSPVHFVPTWGFFNQHGLRAPYLALLLFPASQHGHDGSPRPRCRLPHTDVDWGVLREQGFSGWLQHIQDEDR